MTEKMDTAVASFRLKFQLKIWLILHEKNLIHLDSDTVTYGTQTTPVKKYLSTHDCFFFFTKIVRAKKKFYPASLKATLRHTSELGPELGRFYLHS